MLDLAKCFSHSRDLGFITDARGVILAATSGTERALGFTQLELVGQDLSHLDETGDLRRFFEAHPVRSRMNLGFHLRTKPGPILAVSALATSLRDEGGEPVGWFLAAQDLKGAVGEARSAQPILDALIDSIGAALWSFDRNGSVITWSRACEAEFSLPREEAEGKLSAERLFESPGEYRRVIETVDQAGRFSGEVSLRGPGRALRPTHLSVTPLVAGGLPVGYSAVSIDLADRKRVEELKRTYFEQAGGAILVVDLETLRVVDANARASEMNGYPREELIGLHVSALRPPDAPDSDEVIMQALQKEGRYVNDRERGRRKDGSVFPCEVDLRRITAGGKSYSVTVVHDLTAQRRAEEFQRILFEQAGEAILVCDQATLQVIDVNGRACEMHGYPREEFLRLRVPDFVAPQDYPRMDDIGVALKETGRYDGRQILRRRDGSLFPCELNLRTVVLEDRRLTVAVYRDQTEQLKAQEFQRILFEQAGEAILVVEQPTRRIVDANARASELHGYTKEEFLKLSIPDLLPAEHHPMMGEVGRILRETGRYDGQLFHRRKDGSVFPCGLNLKTVTIGDRKLVICVYRDLTDQLKAQEFFRVLFEKASDAVYLVSDEGLRVVEANEAACRLLGYARGEFLKLAVVDLVPPPYRSRIPEFHASVRNGDGYRRDRRVLFRKDGGVVAVDHAVSRVEISGRPYYIASCRDLTDQERAARELEEAKASLERHVAERTAQLRESEERFRGAFAEGGIGMALVGLDGRFLQVNRTLCEMLGYEEPDLLETTFQAITHPEDKEKSTELARRMIQGQASARMVKRYLRRDGRVLWTDLSTTLLRDGAGAPFYFVTTIQDITEQKRAQEELERRVVERTAELARANELLHEEIVERKRAEKAFRLILEGTAALTGGSFFRSLVRQLATALDVRYANILQGAGQPPGRARTLAFWDGKDFALPVDYDLKGTPCEDVMAGEACGYGHDVQRLFPDVRMLAELGVESYLGAPMMDSAGAVVGILSVLDTKPVADEELKLSVLKIFAARAGIELERQLAEEALRESEERWRSLVTNAPDVILTVDREGRILSINRTVTGFTEASVLGRRAHEFVAPEAVPRVDAALEKAFGEGKASSYETMSYGPNGTKAWYITRVGPVKVGGQVVCATFIATDITERWKGEQRQKVQHEVTRVLAEASSLQDAAPRILRRFCDDLDWQVGFLWWLDPVAEVLRFADAWHAPNPACEEFVKASRLLTFTPGKGVLGLAWSRKEAMWTPDLQEDPRFFRPDIPGAAGLRTQFLLPVEGPRGVFGILEFYSSEKRERDEALLQLASTVGSQIGQFIERKRAEEDLRFQKSLLESQSEAAIDGILVVSRDGVMTSFNRRFCQMWDIPEDVIQSRTDERALQAVLDKLLDPKEFIARVRHLYDHPDEESRDEIRLSDGRAFDRYSAPVKGSDGKLYGRVWYFRDITGRKQTEENLRRAAQETRQMYEDLKEAQAQLIRSEKLASIGMLVSGVAHEINNPLNVMYGNLQLLAEVSDVLLPLAVEGARSKKVRGTASRVGKFRGMIRDALKAARHAREIVQDFRNFARDTRTAELVDLNDCLEEAVTLMQRELPHGIRVVRKLKRIPQVRCLRGQISQVFLNLLKNAGEAIERKGTITLRTSLKDGHAVVEVADSGRGMPEEIRRKLFEPFFTTKPVGKGLGLGLSISAMIVHNHSGRITVRSRPGRGSVFRVELPLPV